jgi:2-polyprenyl-3-methyl-5-hydroxy-6-metoxy-1,4-benzoquinol methylase
MTHSYSFIYIVHNAGTYLWYSLLNTLELCKCNPNSEIIIVEGCDNFHDVTEFDNRGFSIDGTKEIIESFNTSQIKYFRLGKLGDQRQLWNYAFSKVSDTDYVFLRYEYEFIKEQDFIRLDHKIKREDVVDLKIVRYWGDFQHKLPSSDFQERVIRNIDGKGYLTWYDKIELVSGGTFRDRGNSLSIDVPISNFDLVRSSTRLIKDRMRECRENNWVNNHVRSIPGWVETDPIVYSKKIHSFVPYKPELVLIKEKEYPKILEKHPFWGLDMDHIKDQASSFPLCIGDEILVHKALDTEFKILEVGCGPGKVLEQFKDMGECHGLDPSLFAVKYGRTLDLDMTYSTLEEVWFEKGYFDLIYGIDVLEHTKEPIKAFQNMVKWLKPSGVLILSCPNPGHGWSKVCDHFLWSPLQHFSIPSEKAFKSLADQNNLEIKSLEAEGHNLWFTAVKRI